MALLWEQIVVDSLDPVVLGKWWARALGWAVTGEESDEVEIQPLPGKTPGMIFVRVSEPKVGKNRLHVDLRPQDQAGEVDRFLALGATRADVGQHDVPWVVLADPEGNEFCVLTSRPPAA
jgi:hypothetical protein